MHPHGFGTHQRTVSRHDLVQSSNKQAWVDVVELVAGKRGDRVIGPIDQTAGCALSTRVIGTVASIYRMSKILLECHALFRKG